MADAEQGLLRLQEPGDGDALDLIEIEQRLAEISARRRGGADFRRAHRGVPERGHAVLWGAIGRPGEEFASSLEGPEAPDVQHVALVPNAAGDAGQGAQLHGDALGNLAAEADGDAANVDVRHTEFRLRHPDDQTQGCALFAAHVENAVFAREPAWKLPAGQIDVVDADADRVGERDSAALACQRIDRGNDREVAVSVAVPQLRSGRQDLGQIDAFVAGVLVDPGRLRGQQDFRDQGVRRRHQVRNSVDRVPPVVGVVVALGRDVLAQRAARSGDVFHDDVGAHEFPIEAEQGLGATRELDGRRIQLPAEHRAPILGWLAGECHAPDSPLAVGGLHAPFAILGLRAVEIAAVTGHLVQGLLQPDVVRQVSLGFVSPSQLIGRQGPEGIRQLQRSLAPEAAPQFPREGIPDDVLRNRRPDLVAARVVEQVRSGGCGPFGLQSLAHRIVGTLNVLLDVGVPLVQLTRNGVEVLQVPWRTEAGDERHGVLASCRDSAVTEGVRA